MKNLIVPLLFILSSFSLFGQDYNWPYESSNNQGQIIGTIGEIRGGGWRFHKGCDLTHTGSTNPTRIYAINSGVVTFNNGGAHGTCATDWYSYSSYVKVDDIYYIHVKPTDDILQQIANAPAGESVTVNAGDYIGDYLVNCNIPVHCHLQRNNTNLLNRHLTPFTDTTSPYFNDDSNRLENGAAFYRDGLLYTDASDGADLELDETISIDGVDYTKLYGNVDIAAHIIDPRTSSTGGNGGGQCVPYGYQYSLSDCHGNQDILQHEILWSRSPNNTVGSVTIPHILFHPLSVSSGNPTIHVLTANPYAKPYDRWLNTRKLEGATENYESEGNRHIIDSKISASSTTPDGIYELEIDAWDADHGSSKKNEVSRRFYLLFDNFKPFIQNIEVRNHQGVLSFEASWQQPDLESGTMTLNRRNIVPLEEDQPFTVKVIASEPLSSLTLRIDEFNQEVTFDDNYATEFTFSFDNNVLSNTGDFVLDFQGVDLANNSLQTGMQYIPYRDADGSWFDDSDGSDRNHTINVRDVSACEGNRAENRLVTASCGEGLIDGCNYIDFQADKSNPAISELVNFKPTITEPGWTLDWNFGANAEPSTYRTTYDGEDLTGEASAIFLTEGPQTVSLTISKEGEESLTLTYGDCIDVGGDHQNEMTISSINASLTEPRVNETVTFSASVQGSTGELRYNWDFGYLSEYESNDVASPSVTYLSEGVRNIRVTISDDYSSVTKTVNALVSVEGLYNKIQAQFYEPSVDFGPRIICNGNYVVGTGDDSSIKTYQWDFGDGVIAPGQNVVHYYRDPGIYNVTMKVCDNTGCDTETHQIVVSQDDFPSLLNPVFTINDERILQYANETQVQLPNFQVEEVDIRPGDLVNIQATFPARWILDGQAGTHEINLMTQRQAEEADDERDHCFIDVSSVTIMAENGDFLDCFHWYPGRYLSIIPADYVDPGESFLVGLNVSMGISGQQYTTKVNYLCGPEILDYCDFEIQDFSLSSYCWDDSNPIEFDLEAPSHCGNNSLIYNVVIPGVLSQRVNNPWSIEDKPTEFPFSTTAYITAGLFCENDYVEVYNKGYDITIYGPPPAIEVQNEHHFCYGASGRIGIENADPGMSYEWTSSDPDALNYLSSVTDPNPVFAAVGAANSAYTYTVTMTENNYGCSSVSETITVNTSGILEFPYSVDIPVGTNQLLDAPIVGDGSSYTYSWSPTTYLSNPNVANPIFIAPDVATNIDYTVAVSFRGECSAVISPVAVRAINTPPSDLRLTAEVNAMKLEWQDNSLESKFVVERSENGSGYSHLIDLPAGTTSFRDVDCITPNNKYCYRVRAYDVENNLISLDGVSATNSECARPIFKWHESWSINLDDIYTEEHTFNFPRVGQAFEQDGDILFTTTTYPASGNSLRNFKFLDINKSDGEITNTYENVTSGESEEFSHSVKYGSNHYYVADQSYLDKIWYYNGTNIQGSFVGGGSQDNDDQDLSRKMIAATGKVYYFRTTFAYKQDLPSQGGEVEYDGTDIYFSYLNLETDNSLGKKLDKLITPHKDGYAYNLFDVTDYTTQHVKVLYEKVDRSIMVKDLFVGIGVGFDSNKEFVTSKEFDNLKFMGNNRVAGTLKSPYNSETNIWIGNIAGSSLQEETFIEGSHESQTRLFKVIPRTDNEYLFVTTSNSGVSDDKSEASTGTDLWLIGVHEHGNVLWEKTIDYPYADKLFEATLIDKDHLLIGGIVDQANHQVNLTMFTSFPSYNGNPNICGTYEDGSTLVETGLTIDVADNCDATFEDGSYAELLALESVTLHPGTTIQEGADFTAKVSETFDTDCLDEYTAGRHLTVNEDEESFQAELNGGGAEQYNELTVYPNENRGSFNVRRHFEQDEEYQITIYSLEGRQVHLEFGKSAMINQNISINVDIGIYLVELTTGSGLKEVQRIVIKH